jgi:hypothetical protein
MSSNWQALNALLIAGRLRGFGLATPGIYQQGLLRKMASRPTVTRKLDSTGDSLDTYDTASALELAVGGANCRRR